MIDYIYIMGLPHSGSTLLTFLLNTHPDIGTIGEPQLLGRRLPTGLRRYPFECSCGKHILQCDMWAHILNTNIDLLDTIHPSVFNRYHRMNPKHRLALFNRYDTFVTNALIATGGKTFVDADKDPQKVSMLLDNPYFNVKVINLVRDGRGVYNSFLRHGNNFKLWQKLEESRGKVLESLSKAQYITIKYEELCNYPAIVLKYIFFKLRLQKFPINLDFRSVDHHIWGGVMRLVDSSEIELHDLWRKQLSKKDLELFRKSGEEINLRNGYGKTS